MITQIFNWRTALALLAIAIVTGTVFYSNYLSQKIAADEREKVDVWVQSLKTRAEAKEQVALDLTNAKAGDKIPVKMAIDDEEYDMYVRYDGKEKYETKLGTFNCIKLKPLLNKGEIFKEGEGMTLWLTDDDNRIPVRIESDLKVGRITCDLKSYGGNKYLFTSKVE